jgi:CheY-like chemotaxis protein
MAEKKQILIVEDDVDLVEMLSAYFRVQGYEVLTASWGEDAVKLALETVPDLALLDIRLPDIDGFEVCRRLRQVRKTQSLPVIFLTEKRERSDRLSGLELGAVDYITKPFDVQELRLRVRNVLRRSQFQALVNPVTALPEGEAVREKLETMLGSDDWGVVLAGVRNLTQFRNRYGFVASDDVARAVSLMLTKTVQEQGPGGENDFVGHVDAVDFVIITKSDRASRLAKKCEMRLAPAVPYFYPAIDREKVANLPDAERLQVSVSSLVANGQCKTLDDLRQALAIELA